MSVATTQAAHELSTESSSQPTEQQTTSTGEVS